MESTNYKKHTTKNPLQRFLIGRFYTVLVEYVRQAGSKTILDAGCGEGFTLDRLHKEGVGTRYEGFDASAKAVTIGKKMFPHLQLAQGDIYAISQKDRSFDLVICSEVLEHLEDPAKALSELRRVSDTYLLLTVPWEPWFQITNFLLGKYVRRWGNHPEHINHWSLRSFATLLRKNKLTVIQRRISFPWIMVLARR